ncbi:MAG: IPTL-CTERM sorting domain-containing protein [Thermodesulfobacteriota bacterium]
MSNGLTGNEIVEIVCPGGNLGDDSSSFVDSNDVAVSLENFPHTDYVVEENNVGDKDCVINTDGVEPVTLQITDQEYNSCRERLITGCDLHIRNIPTLSEWGLIAMAGVFGIIGLFAIRRMKAVT